MIIAINGDATSLDYYYGKNAEYVLAQIEQGLTRLGPHLVPDFDSETGRGVAEFTNRECGCCKTTLTGARHDFAILGPA